LIIADEGHRLRSIEAKTTQALRSLKTKRRVVLSGTPIQNNLTEYYAMVDFVNPGILEDYRTFKKKFEQPILKSREPCCNPVQRSEGEARAEELAKMSRHYVLRRGSEVIQEHLPPRHDYCVFISPTTVQRNIYQAVLDSPETRAIFSGDISQHLVLMNTLKLLCNVEKIIFLALCKFRSVTDCKIVDLVYPQSPGLLMNEYSIKSLGQISSTLFPAWVTRDDVQLSGKMQSMKDFFRPHHLGSRITNKYSESRQIDSIGKVFRHLEKEEQRENNFRYGVI
jgi:DNA repair and recombination protein RAD54B